MLQDWRKISAALLALLALALIAVGAWVNCEALNEAYGSRPPYYGRTTNMDKWGDPVPDLRCSTRSF